MKPTTDQRMEAEAKEYADKAQPTRWTEQGDYFNANDIEAAVKHGWQARDRVLMESAESFDEKAALEDFTSDRLDDYTDEFRIQLYLRGRREQHSQDKLALAALKLSEELAVAKLNEVVEAKDAEIERLKAELGQCYDNYKIYETDIQAKDRRIAVLEEALKDLLAITRGHGNFANVQISIENAESLLRKSP